MKIILFVILLAFSYNGHAMSKEKNKCENLVKLSKDYASCKANIINKKISNNKISKIVKEFSKKKTLIDLFEKK